VQTFIYQFVVLTKINRLTLKRFGEKYLPLSGFTLEVEFFNGPRCMYSNRFTQTKHTAHE